MRQLIKFQKTFSALMAFILLALCASGALAQPNVELFNEPFDNSTGFTTSTPFFSDAQPISSGFDYFGISDGAGGGDFGTGDPAQTFSDTYDSSFTGNFLTGQDLDGEGAALPITVEWTGINIAGRTNLQFSGDFAETVSSNVDQADFILVEYQIDGGGYQNLLAFRGYDFVGNDEFNGFFYEDTDFNGVADGIQLTTAAQTFTKAIAGTGSTLDLRLSVSVDSGDEDFGIDNFIITGIGGSPPTFTKNFTPNPTVIDTPSLLTLTIDNSASTVDATSLDVIDVLPAGMVVAATPNVTTNCEGGTVTAVAGSASISYTGGAVSAGSVCQISVDVIAVAAGVFVNTTGDLTSSLGNSGSASATLSVNSVSYSVGGSVSGLTGSGLVLQNNGGDDLSLAVSATSFTFATSLADSSAYTVSVLTQPAGQACTASDGSGTISGANVTNVAVDCADDAPPPPPPSSPSKPIPTLSEWALFTLAIILGFMGLGRIRRTQ